MQPRVGIRPALVSEENHVNLECWYGMLKYVGRSEFHVLGEQDWVDGEEE